MDKKLNLDDLKVQSFVTALSETEDMAVRGGLSRRSCDTEGYPGTPCAEDTVTMCSSLIYCDTGSWNGCWPPIF